MVSYSVAKFSCDVPLALVSASHREKIITSCLGEYQKTCKILNIQKKIEKIHLISSYGGLLNTKFVYTACDRTKKQKSINLFGIGVERESWETTSEMILGRQVEGTGASTTANGIGAHIGYNICCQ